MVGFLPHRWLEYFVFSLPNRWLRQMVDFLPHRWLEYLVVFLQHRWLRLKLDKCQWLCSYHTDGLNKSYFSYHTDGLNKPGSVEAVPQSHVAYTLQWKLQIIAKMFAIIPAEYSQHICNHRQIIIVQHNGRLLPECLQ